VSLNVRSSEWRRKPLSFNRNPHLVSETQHACRRVHLPILFAIALLSPSPSLGQLNAITSVGFATAYNELVGVFQKSTGITVSNEHFASQVTKVDPTIIAAQRRAGAVADVVIMSKEGLGDQQV
jgi:spermidine/putrescine-binding protein